MEYKPTNCQWQLINKQRSDATYNLYTAIRTLDFKTKLRDPYRPNAEAGCRIRNSVSTNLSQIFSAVLVVLVFLHSFFELIKHKHE